MSTATSAATAELLLELFSEEIPSRMQVRAADDLKRLVTEGLVAAGLKVDGALAFATPRRLVLTIPALPAQSPGVSEEKKGPRVGAPEAAVQGFLKSAGLASLAQAEIVTDTKKGDFYVAKIEKAGRPASEIVTAVVPDVMRKFPWPKAMRWGAGSFTWVRPLQSIVCLLGGEVVPFEIGGVTAGRTTRGHRFHGTETIEVTGFEDYAKKLRKAKVLLPSSERAGMIAEQAEAVARAQGLQLVEDQGLLAENAGLTEWPTALMGTFDEDFLAVPAECLTTAMRAHQKCFSVRDPKTGKLANRFVAVSNLIAKDGGKEIVAGNEKVIRARLSDAKFFWEQDLKKPLDEMASALDGITFHEKLGSQRQRVERISELAFRLAGAADAVPEDARRAGQLAKADLVSGMVGEFPELQGLMGRYYAQAAGTKAEIARAIELHYKPKGPTDTVPREEDGDAVAIAVALADKIDTLVGFWAIGEKPTGSGDPYQLRRAALGVIRIALENDLRLSLIPVFARAATDLRQAGLDFAHWDGIADLDEELTIADDERSHKKHVDDGRSGEIELARSLLAFLADRLKVHLREKGARHDLIDAVFALPGQDDLALIVKRVEALSEFLKTDDGANLLAGVKRAANILSAEEKKDKRSHTGDYNLELLSANEELALAAAIESVKQDTAAAIAVENFAGAMRALAELRAPVDAFFDKVTVNADDPKVRENRLRLLSQIRATTLGVADLSKVGG